MNRPLGFKIPPKAPEKTTFARPLVNKAKLAAVAAAAAKATATTASASRVVPPPVLSTETSGQTETQKKGPISQDEVPETGKAPPITGDLHLELPDTSRPPPNLTLPKEQLPDLTKLPPTFSCSESENPALNSSLGGAEKPLNKTESENSPNDKSLPVSRKDPIDVDILQKTFLEEMMESFLNEKEKNEAKLAEIRKTNELDKDLHENYVNVIKSQLSR